MQKVGGPSPLSPTIFNRIPKGVRFFFFNGDTPTAFRQLAATPRAGNAPWAWRRARCFNTKEHKERRDGMDRSTKFFGFRGNTLKTMKITSKAVVIARGGSPPLCSFLPGRNGTAPRDRATGHGQGHLSLRKGYDLNHFYFFRKFISSRMKRKSIVLSFWKPFPEKIYVHNSGPVRLF